MRLKKVFAGIAAAATMLGGLALGATTANAAENDASTITITGDVAGRTFTAYPLGAYTNVVANAEHTAATSVDFVQNAAWADKSIAEAAAEAAKVGDASSTVPAQYKGNELAWIASLDETNDGAKLRKFAETLAASTTKPSGADVVAQTGADGATSVDLDVPAEGWYLVTDTTTKDGVTTTTGAPILVGTKVTISYKDDQGQSQSVAVNKLNTTTLGTANAKPETVPTPDKEIVEDDPQNPEHDTVNIGDELPFKITAKVPNTTGYETYSYTITDTATKGLAIQKNTFTVAVGNGTSSTTYTKVNSEAELKTTPNSYYISFNPNAADGSVQTVTTIKLSNMAGKDGQTVTVTYKANVTDDAEQNKVTNSAVVNANGKTSGEGIVTRYFYGFEFAKVQKGDNGSYAGLNGAEFKIFRSQADLKAWENTKDTSTPTDNSLKFTYTDTNGVYMYAPDDNNASNVVTSAQFGQSHGLVNVNGLAAGTYYVVESKAPDGFLQNVLAKFTVTISKDNNGKNALFANNNTPDLGLLLTDKDSAGRKQVLNVTSITQLPLTGAAGTALFTVIGVLLAGAAVTVLAKSRNTKRALNA